MGDEQDTHSKLRKLADLISALFVNRLEDAKKGEGNSRGENRKDVAVSATPASMIRDGNRGTRGGPSPFRMPVIGGDAAAKSTPSFSSAVAVDEGRGCGAAIVLDNTQWLDHNSWELMHLLRKALPGMLIFAAFRPFSEMNLKHNIALKTVPGTLKMNMGRLTATQVMLILSDSFGVQRTSEELLEFLEARKHFRRFPSVFEQETTKKRAGAVLLELGGSTQKEEYDRH